MTLWDGRMSAVLVGVDAEFEIVVSAAAVV